MLYNEKIGEMTPDNLVASTLVHQITSAITIPSGTGVLKRGTVVDSAGAVMASGKTAYAILCDDVDTTAGSVVAEVYVAGCFNANALIVAEGYTLTAADLLALRNGGIYIENAME